MILRAHSSAALPVPLHSFSLAGAPVAVARVAHPCPGDFDGLSFHFQLPASESCCTAPSSIFLK